MVMVEAPQYVIGTDPRHDERVFITHTQEPFFVAEIFHLRSQNEEQQMELKKTYEIASSFEYRNMYVLVGVLQLVQSRSHTSDELATLIRKTADWYQAVLKSNEEIV